MGMSIYGETYRKRGKTFIKGVSGFPYTIEKGQIYYDQDIVFLNETSSNYVELFATGGSRYTGSSLEEIFKYIDDLEKNNRQMKKAEFLRAMIALGCFVVIGAAFCFFPIWPFVLLALKIVLIVTVSLIGFFAIIAFLMQNSIINTLFAVIVLGLLGLTVAGFVKPTKEDMRARAISTETADQEMRNFFSSDESVDPIEASFDRLFEESYARAILERPGSVHNPRYKEVYRSDLLEKIWEPRLDRLRKWFLRHDALESNPPVGDLLQPFPMPWEID
jgi:hypothetical protein